MSEKIKFSNGASITPAGKDEKWEGIIPWYDKSNGEVNKRLLATYTFKNNGLRYELELVRDLLKAYDAKCEELADLEAEHSSLIDAVNNTEAYDFWQSNKED